MNQPRAVVIGAGIGGLTAAAALHLRGWAVTVLERAAALEPVGAGIALAPNAQRALDVIGVGDAVRAMSAWQGEGGLRTPSGRWLSRTTPDAAAERFGGPVVVAHRADLVGLLAALLPAGAVRTGTPAEVADPGEDGRPATVRATGGDGRSGVREYTADLVVAADGIHSAARQVLFPGHPAPRYAGFTAWRFVVPAPERPFSPHETWGPGSVWGTVPLHDGRVYAYATATVPAGERSPDGERAELLRRFGDWHHPVPDLLAAVRPDGVLRGDVYRAATAPPAYHQGRTALLGDAAHAMTPNLGQGGCQAIEDAVVLAHHAGPGAAGGAGLERRLAAYTRDRLPRTMEVVRRSGRIGRLTTWSSPPARALRTAAFTALDRLGPRLALRSLDGIADWEPPCAAYAAGPRGTRGGGGAAAP
ncbi:FAD-dependent monooxygenase [Streptomyces pini]|uniref:2-polyprenyl-6-methoxyphenol hydroxylase n=1 Tax=Streptomyces pini TaxID=1520580 RepID=A0A1I3X8K0_9ACTN|nr:FAD-dependent monooxygenase [Streptomyces pini]SFK15221.1 2-polyprenyl-6-methoxyphenol hydroxylase [Streptomyces pini]